MGAMETRPLAPKHPDSPHVPVVGMGTSGTFDTDDIGAVASVVDAALAAGTTLFDSSPMYGKAERVLGAALGERRSETLIATKVWTDDDGRAESQMDTSASFYGGRVDLMQIHNMVRWRTRLDQIEARRDAGEVAYIGATHWQVEGFGDLESAMGSGRLDAIQIPYNPIEREVETRILPLAAELGLGVLIMRPFARADLLRCPPPDPDLAPFVPFGVTTWAQALLKWGLSHPATTVAIPATTRPSRAVENSVAGRGLAFDQPTRERLAELFR